MTRQSHIGAAPTSFVARLVVAVTGLVLVAGSLLLPLWTSSLQAPQYPGGLSLVAFWDRAEGDLAEIDSLNHYVGMRPFRFEDFPEAALWPLGVGVGLVAVIAGVWLAGRLPGRLALLYLWMLPLAVLAVIQIRLHQFGHDLDPGAAFRMDGFTPWVVGPTRVWNFTAWSMPGWGIFALLLAAAITTWGPRLLSRMGPLPGRAAGAALVAAVLVVGPGLGVLATDHSGHDHLPLEGPMPQPSGRGFGPDLPEGVLSRPPVDLARLGDLQSMISATPDGGTLVVPPGNYRGNVVIDRPMTVRGQGWPLVVGDGVGTVLTVAASGVTVHGLQVTGSGVGPGGQPAGIRVTGDEVWLEQVVVDDSYIGIAIDGASKVRIVDCLVVGRAGHAADDDGHATGGGHDGHTTGGRGDGVSLWHAEGVLVRGTLIAGTRDGIYVSFGSQLLVDGNRIVNNRYGIHTMFADELVIIENEIVGNLSGLVLMYGGGVDVIRNLLSANRSPSTGFGALVKDVREVELVQNVVTGNRVGVHLDGPAGGTEPIRVTANTIADNAYGVVLFPSASAVLAANSFVDNLVQVGREGRSPIDMVEWSDRGWGNYWSNYTGYDNGQGKGAVAHVEGSAVHRVVTRSPMLTAIVGGPAMRLVAAVEERWLGQRPAAIDPSPLLSPVSPPARVTDADPAAGGFTAVLAAIMVGVSAAILVRGMRGGRWRYV